MKHLPFNHCWEPMGADWYREPTDHMCTDYRTCTELKLFCRCGKVKRKTIAEFRMNERQINRYVKEVYGDFCLVSDKPTQ